ncbi:PREDICTED: tetratricopeptide repeat protein 36 [Nanorana parkeri]|uniref:tetratricopeptide repeat protein 36 n=1 Tax=Nanorana parkeri TaxID=125878 RepID=UPI0008544BE8|nr:PREDICTED: tetratricopeptide repeat protein 36 [Nanorana parkeri]
MCTPNDAAVLHALFHPNAPFGDLNEQNEEHLQEDTNQDCSFPAALLEEAHNLELIGVRAAESGDLKTALQRFSKAIELLPDRASAYNNRAQALRLQGDITGALGDLNHALELSRGKGVAGRQALVQRGLIFRLNGNEEAAKNDFLQAAEQGSDFAKQQLVLLNPYAALCNKMLRDMIQNLYVSNP